MSHLQEDRPRPSQHGEPLGVYPVRGRGHKDRSVDGSGFKTNGKGTTANVDIEHLSSSSPRKNTNGAQLAGVHPRGVRR
jgi:hypothetical protein